VGTAKRSGENALGLRLRPASNKDCQDVVRLVEEVLREYKLAPDPACTDADLRDIEESYFNRGGIFYVLEEKDGSIVGTYGLCPVEGRTCELRKDIYPKSIPKVLIQNRQHP